MDNFDFANFLEVSGKEIQAQLERAGFYRHPSGIGDRREEIVRNVLIDILPPRFSVDRGKIVDSTGKLSKEFDVVISEKADVVPPMIIGGRKIIPVETVYGVIEIKSNLTKRDYDTFISAVVDLDEMVRFYEPLLELSTQLQTRLDAGVSVLDENFGKIWSGIIAVNAPQGETLARWLQTCAESLWFICIPGRELATISYSPGGWVSRDYGDKSFPMLIWMIMGLLTSNKRRFRLFPKMQKYTEHIINVTSPVTRRWSAVVTEEETTTDSAP